jgi:hypothetical protein
MRGPEATPWLDFWLLETRLTDRSTMRTFDSTADGKHIVFDRARENSAMAVIETQPEK